MYIGTIVVAILYKPEGPGRLYVGRASSKGGGWGLSIVAFLAVSRDFL
jgi:hypothetical protein